MKKLIILLTTLFCLLSCEESPKSRYKCLVEEKWETLGGAYKLTISEVNALQNLYVVNVGKHTYDNTQPGDTIIVYK